MKLDDDVKRQMISGVANAMAFCSDEPGNKEKWLVEADAAIEKWIRINGEFTARGSVEVSKKLAIIVDWWQDKAIDAGNSFPLTGKARTN